MAVNRFDTPAQAQFLNTYVPIPFNELKEAGLSKQQEYDINKSGFESARAEAGQLQYIPNSSDEDYIRNVVLPTFENISDKYSSQDFSDPNIVREINNQVRANIDKERVRRIQESAKNYQIYQRDLSKLGSQGRTAPYLNQFNPSEFSSEFDIFNRTPEAALDFNKEAESYFNQLRDTHLGYNSETGMTVSGVTPQTVQEVAKANLVEFMSSPTGQQAIQAMKYRGDNRDDATIALDVLNSRGMEFVRKNIGFAPGSGSSRGSQDNIPIAPIDFTLRSQPTELTNLSRKQLSKDVEKYESERLQLENQLTIAKQYGQQAVAANLQNKIQELDDANTSKIYWNDQIKNNVQSKFNKELDNLSNSFRNDIGDAISDSNAISKWSNAYRNALQTKNLSKLDPIAEVNKTYIELYGKDDPDYTKWDQAMGYKYGKLTKAINKHINETSSLRNKIYDLEDKEWQALRAEGLMENTTVLPIVETSADYNHYPEWRSLNNLFKSTPEDFKIDIVSSDKVSDKDRSNYIKDIKNANSLDLVSASPGDTQSPFIYVNASFKNKQGDLEKSDVGYKIRIQSPSQSAAVGQTFLRQGNVYEGLKWLDPNISINVEKAFKNNIKPDAVGVNILGENVIFKKMNNEYYLVDNTGNVVDNVPLDKEGIKRYAYTIFGSNSGYINK